MPRTRQVKEIIYPDEYYKCERCGATRSLKEWMETTNSAGMLPRGDVFNRSLRFLSRDLLASFSDPDNLLHYICPACRKACAVAYFKKDGTNRYIRTAGDISIVDARPKGVNQFSPRKFTHEQLVAQSLKCRK